MVLHRLVRSVGFGGFGRNVVSRSGGVALIAAFALAMPLAACDDGKGGGDTDGAGDSGDGDGDGDLPWPDPPSTNRWEKIEPPGTVCGNGSQYKFFVNYSRTGSKNVAVFMEPGGACWDYPSCTGADGVRGAANINGIPDDHMDVWGIYSPLIARDGGGPFEDWNLVFIPYCTADVHTGDRVRVYEDPEGVGEPVEFHHKGHDNVMAVIDWMAEKMPSIDDFWLGGCSAGGAGTQINYYFMRTGLNAKRGFALNDSGPIFPNSTNSAPLHAKIRDEWGVDPVIDQIPIAESIKDDFGNLNSLLSEEFPDDRMAITYFMRDLNYSSYSYERFFDDVDDDLLHQLWAEDTELLIEQYDELPNLSYYIPYFRNFNESHCTTILTPAGSEIDDFDVMSYTWHLMDTSQPLESYVDRDGDKLSD